MLTRDEADILKKEIEYASRVDPKCEFCRSLYVRQKNLIESINKLTEKPKPEIKLENIVKAIQVLANIVGVNHLHHNIDCHGVESRFHSETNCGICGSLGVVDELLEGKDE